MHGNRVFAPDATAQETDKGVSSQMRYEAFMAKTAPEDEALMQLDTYQAEIRPITPDDRKLLHELTVGVFWPHRGPDLDLFLSLGKGYLALDEIGRPLGSAMYFHMGDDFAMCGMMVTTPRLQSHGAGRRLLRRILRDCAGRDLRLSATRSGYRLYESAGFDPVSKIWQQQGVARAIRPPEPVPGLVQRALTPDDLAAMVALDTHAYGATRPQVIAEAFTQSTGVGVERDGALVGYALKRPFGRGEVIGPVIAESDQMAMQLVAPLIQQSAGQFCRLDTPQQSERFTAFLAAAGLGVFDTVTEMRIGPFRRAETGALLYGLVSHSLG